MNKKLLPIAATFCLAAAMLTLGSCENATRTYAKKLKAEKKLIEQYVERNNITIIYEEPAYDQWKENEYLELEEYCYFHLTSPGDTTKPALETNDRFSIIYPLLNSLIKEAVFCQGYLQKLLPHFHTYQIQAISL